MIRVHSERWSNVISISPRECNVNTLAHLGLLDLAISRARTYPEEIRYTDKHGRSVLHQAMRKNPSLENIQDLLDLHPEAIYQQDSFDRSPVDIALCYGVNSDVVEYMESKKMLSQLPHNNEDVVNAIAEKSSHVTRISADIVLDRESQTVRTVTLPGRVTAKIDESRIFEFPDNDQEQPKSILINQSLRRSSIKGRKFRSAMGRSKYLTPQHRLSINPRWLSFRRKKQVLPLRRHNIILKNMRVKTNYLHSDIHDVPIIQD